MSFPDKIRLPRIEELDGASGVSRKAANNWNQYYKRCKQQADMFRDVLAAEFAPPFAGLRMLEWGSALGGVSILLSEETELDVHAADVDLESTKWLRKQNVRVTCWNLEPKAKLPFEGDYFDAILGVSVFTHLSPDLVDFYLKELRRVTKDGGVVYLTVRSHYALDHNPPKAHIANLYPQTHAELEEAGIFYRSYPRETQSKLGFSDDYDYGVASHSHRFIQEVFGKYFEILAHEEGKIPPQDMIVLRKC